VTHSGHPPYSSVCTRRRAASYRTGGVQVPQDGSPAPVGQAQMRAHHHPLSPHLSQNVAGACVAFCYCSPTPLPCWPCCYCSSCCTRCWDWIMSCCCQPVLAVPQSLMLQALLVAEAAQQLARSFWGCAAAGNWQCIQLGRLAALCTSSARPASGWAPLLTPADIYQQPAHVDTKRLLTTAYQSRRNCLAPNIFGIVIVARSGAG
jgi:hypothetical protein